MTLLQPVREQVRFSSVLPSISSGVLNSAGQVITGKCLLTGCLVYTDGNNDATIVLYDNTAGSGKVVTKFLVVSTENFGGAIFSSAPIVVDNGIYVSITGTGATCIVYYYSPKFKRNDVLL